MLPAERQHLAPPTTGVDQELYEAERNGVLEVAGEVGKAANLLGIPCGTPASDGRCGGLSGPAA